MDRAEIISRLRSTEAALRAHGVGALYMFGTQARGDASPASDVDLFVDPATDEFHNLEACMAAYFDLKGGTWRVSDWLRNKGRFVPTHA